MTSAFFLHNLFGKACALSSRSRHISIVKWNPGGSQLSGEGPILGPRVVAVKPLAAIFDPELAIVAKRYRLPACANILIATKFIATAVTAVAGTIIKAILDS
jgi:hypothetical protein